MALHPLLEELQELEKALPQEWQCALWLTPLMPPTWQLSEGMSWLGSEKALRSLARQLAALGAFWRGFCAGVYPARGVGSPWESTPPSPHLDLKSSR